jgi:hypothetical protein
MKKEGWRIGIANFYILWSVNERGSLYLNDCILADQITTVFGKITPNL